MSKVRFKANVRIKDVVGRDLINNDNVAIIELIKNAKDAGSARVEITFSGANRESKGSQIIIQDYGHGMSLSGITDKWLNMAYSEKRTQTKKKVYAGSKGIGRFSCDRLGRSLDLYTKTPDGKLLWLYVDWTKFEVDEIDKEISHIDFNVEEIDFNTFSKRTHLKKFYSGGTVLVIRDLRSVWDKEKLFDLKKELEKFSLDPKAEFDIYLSCEDYPKEVALKGKIKSKIFEKLSFKTTSIQSEINKDGSQISTSLFHDGRELFTLIEKNPYKNLKSIKTSLYFLNQQAKAFFKRETGTTSVEFGSVFLFLNGFRVLPYGEEQDDWLRLDRRKQQGTKRYFGTRDIIGRVEIVDSTNIFKPVSSREGLVINDAYRELAEGTKTVESRLDGGRLVFGYLPNVIRKLERFVVEDLDWDRLIKEDDQQHISENDLMKLNRDAFVDRSKYIVSGLWSVILTRTLETDIIDVSINDAHLKSLANEAGDEYKTLAFNMKEKLEGVSISKLSPGEKKNLSKFIGRIVKQVEAKEASNRVLEKRTKELKREKDEVSRRLDVEKKRRLFAEASTTLDYKHVLNMHHQIGLLAGDVFKRLDRVFRKYNKDPDSVDKKVLIEAVEKSLFNINKIKQASKFATKANFDMATNNVKEDIVQFLEEYIQNVCRNGIDWGLKIKFENKQAAKLVRTFKPIELTMIADNIMDNAAKASARNLIVKVTKESGLVKIRFVDDGKGIDIKKFKPKDLFDKGITTTDGSGIGLHHVNQIVGDMNGNAKIGNNSDKGAYVLLEF